MAKNELVERVKTVIWRTGCGTTVRKEIELVPKSKNKQNEQDNFEMNQREYYSDQERFNQESQLFDRENEKEY